MATGFLVKLSAEALSVAAGLRPAALMECRESDMPEYEEFFRRAGVARVVVTQDEMHAKRLARGARPSGDRTPGALLVYMARDEAAARRLFETDLLDDSEAMGRALGYPPCCVAYYQLLRKDRANVVSWKPRFLYVPHEPCSPDCAASLKMEAALAGIIEGGGRKLTNNV